MKDILHEKKLGDRLIHVLPLTFGRARIAIGPSDRVFYDDLW